MPSRLLLPLLLASSTALAAPHSYHLELEATPAIAFPYLSRFGTVTLHVFPGGVRADTFWLNGFSRNGMSTVTVENPIGRMYTDVPVEELSAMLRKMSGADEEVSDAAPHLEPAVSGKVGAIAAKRYRLSYGPEAWIDLWTTTTIPEAPQLRAIVDVFVRGISPGTAGVLRSIPGTPLYVEINFSHYKKLPLVRLRRLSLSSDGEQKALSVGRFYFRAPLLDYVWR